MNKREGLFYLRNRKIPTILIVGIIFFAGFCLYIFFSYGIFSRIDDFYLLLTEKFSNLYLRLTGSPVFLEGKNVVENGKELHGFEPETLFKKWNVVLLLFFWSTKTRSRKKIWWSLFLIFFSFFFISLHNFLGAYLLSRNMETERFYALSVTLGELFLITFGFLWYKINKQQILDGYLVKKLGRRFAEEKIPGLFLVIYLYVFLASFLLPAFEFKPWIHFLFTSSAGIIRHFGYHVVVESSYLIGDNGTIYMSKGCLGFKTMLLFASVVYLTGKDLKTKSIYIITGLIVLNIVNIIRFVLLYIHIQKNGGYNLAIDLHELYKYVTYTLVFLMWVLWFEKFSDYKKPFTS